MILLSEEERKRFAAFLREGAESDSAIASLMEQTKMPGGLVNLLRTKATAKMLVAHELEITSDESISRSTR